MNSHSGASIAPKRKGGSKVEEEREETIKKVEESVPWRRIDTCH